MCPFCGVFVVLLQSWAGNASLVELRDQAIHQLRRKRAFERDVVAYVVVNAVLIAIWYFASGHGYFWPGWVLLSWDIVLALHAWNAYGHGRRYIIGRLGRRGVLAVLGGLRRLDRIVSRQVGSHAASQSVTGASLADRPRRFAQPAVTSPPPAPPRAR